ncbi:MAG: YraN family protein [Mobiluncus porci]|uniref:YraN family protein n=1 Tax=Mobiluncus porci TaxID=2652278 RepID=UPI0023F29618|nr:YraN family protein [Mobiluncus porci]MDD7541137.1 YraN family protein [Mobiluncus porci]MDY5748025.1 YraN family protein [Mobiluncus porci]
MKTKVQPGRAAGRKPAGENRPSQGHYRDQLKIQRRAQKRFSRGNSSPRKNPHNRELGLAGEDMAVWFLEASGYEIVDRNWRCRIGEVDIVALTPEMQLAFVEVKTRSSHRHGTPGEAITYPKLSRMRRVMGAWFSVHEAPPHRGVRLDLVSVDWDGQGTPTISHRKGLK